MRLLALAAGLPAIIAALVLLWIADYTPKVQWTITVLILAIWWACASAIRERVASPLRTLANLLEAMREGDYSIRGRGTGAYDGEDALADVMHQVNAMSATLRAQRLGALEATTLLRKVMEEIDVAVFAFDGEQRLRLVNRAGERLLKQPAERILTSSAENLGLAEFLQGEPARTVQRTFPTGAGRWAMTRSMFREGGLPHQLLVVSDLTRALREEELKAWQRLVRVLGHELNNSLAPIKSIAGSLESLMARDPLPDDWRDDARRGLSIIAARSEGLSRFLGAYALLAKLPPPRPAPLEVGMWIRQSATLEQRLTARVLPGPEMTIQGDRDQLEQVIINLLRNAVDASLETGGAVAVSWKRHGARLEVSVEDEGPGLSNTANLFVPFFTTKPPGEGTGLGLSVSYGIIQAHGGTISVDSTPDVGSTFTILLPLCTMATT